MHPLLGSGQRLFIYLAAWLPIGALLGLIGFHLGMAWEVAGALSIPLALVYAFICLAAWYPSRSTPLRSAETWRVLVNHCTAALLSAGLWMGTSFAWASFLDRIPTFAGAASQLQVLGPVIFVFGILLYVLAAGACYLYISAQNTVDAERRALDARRRQELANRELELARGIQRRLLPPPQADTETHRLAARNLAARFVAGDFYDYFPLDDGTLRIAVADVAGKGVAASLITASTKAMLPLIAARHSVVDTLRELNQHLVKQLDRHEFVALLLAAYDPVSRRLEIANAGLPDPYLLRPGEPILPLEVSAPRLPLGKWRDVAYRSLTVDLAAGDRVLFLTDGLPEAQTRRGEPLGYDALVRLVEAGLPPHTEAPITPGPWLDQLLKRLHEATSDTLDDDWTALLFAPSDGSQWPGKESPKKSSQRS